MFLPKGLRSLIFEAEEDGQTATPAKPPAAPSVTTPVISIVPGIFRATNAVNVDPQFLQALQETVENGTPPILSTFSQLLEGLKKDIPNDESQRYAVAITSLTTTARGTVAQLRDAVAERLRALDKAKSLFIQQLEDKATREVGAKEGQVRSLDQQLADLRAQATEIQRQRDALQQEIDAARGQITITQQKFDAAYNHLQATLTNDGEKIASHLPK